MNYSLTAKIGPWIDDALHRHGQGENIAWEAALLPTPEGQAAFTVFVWFPGAILGTSLTGSFQVGDPLNFTSEQVDAVISDFLEQLRQARSAQAGAPAAPGGPVTPPRGGQTASGLLIP